MLKNYQLLTNTTYLWILQHPDERINYSQIAKDVGLSRQTVSKEYKELQGMYDNVYGIVDFHNDEANKIKRAIMIIEDLENKEFTNEQLAIMLGVNRLTISKCRTNYQSKENQMAVYCIKYNNVIIYIGSTINFESRKLQHLSALRCKVTTGMYLYKFCTENNIGVDDVEIIIMADKFNSKAEMLQLETTLIKSLSPVCNEI